MTGTKHTGLIQSRMAPDKITPMLGVHEPKYGMPRIAMENQFAVLGDPYRSGRPDTIDSGVQISHDMEYK